MFFSYFCDAEDFIIFFVSTSGIFYISAVKSSGSSTDDSRYIILVSGWLFFGIFEIFFSGFFSWVKFTFFMLETSVIFSFSAFYFFYSFYSSLICSFCYYYSSYFMNTLMGDKSFYPLFFAFDKQSLFYIIILASLTLWLWAMC